MTFRHSGHTGNEEIRPLHHGKFSMTVTVKSGRGRFLDVDVFVYKRFQLYKRFDWIIFAVLDK